MFRTHQTCPVCDSSVLQPTVLRTDLPTMQNRVYRTFEAAKAAKTGTLDLQLCESCGFVFNNQFDATLLEYDQEYDNSVPSKVMEHYYQQLASYLHDKYLNHDGALVVEIGCGKGGFLKNLCRMFPRVRGLGIDPSYEGPLEEPGQGARFVRDFYGPQVLAERPDLIVCRHVLEHIPNPTEFLRSIAEPIQQFREVPIFVEVPDLQWIVREEAFWDFCFEHCNYFTPASLAQACLRTGFKTNRCTTEFGGQYLWQEAITSKTATSFPSNSVNNLSGSLLQYCAQESECMKRMKHVLRSFRDQGCAIAVWGMATKGILFSTVLDPNSTLIDYCIDVNSNKQGRFVSSTGRLISPPERLCEFPDQRLVVVVMNLNYLHEVQSQCSALGLICQFIDAQGHMLLNVKDRAAA